MSHREQTIEGVTLKRLGQHSFELYEPIGHLPGSKSHSAAVQFGERMKSQGYAGQYVRNEGDKAVVRFFKP